ncbi:hypothetical protein IMSHALPRED_004825 [Imshaugia aleurites]|uniref:Yeast cell wall synthesis Kre9/Knh1-like N-terminal domain-containing protein n=1 Tax=Imshaugia aleurites TaxID=172621 RepID=A0A8H3ING5_9LECA|nr:hypothetical protein IMSHALPRED_004825 [Imshaugia aleurites]
MQISNTLFVCATLIAAAVAQSASTTSLHFTTIPTSLVAGVKETIGWEGGDGSAVNVVLQQGPYDNLQDVSIPPIASGSEGTSVTWTPPKSLPDAGNYALRIEQGEDTVNYSGMLQLFGGCSTCPTDAVAALASASTGSATAPSTSSTASSSATSGVAAPVVASGSKSSSNSTASSGNSTTTGASMNSTMSSGSMANMTMPGTNSTTNSTSSSAKLHATSSKSSSSSSSSSTSSSSTSSTSSSTGSSTSPSSTKKSNGVTVAASNFALVLCAIVGVVYLG